MATPWRHPETKVFYLYRQVPAALRPIIGKTFWKASLHTHDPVEAARRFTAANAELEQRFARARQTLAEQAANDEITAEQATRIVTTFVTANATSKDGRWPSLVLTWCLEEAADRWISDVPAAAVPIVDENGRADAAAMSGLPIAGEAWLRIVRERPAAEWLSACRAVLEPLFKTSAATVVRCPRNETALMLAWNERVITDLARLRSELEEPRLHANKSRLRPDLRFGELLRAWAKAQKPRPQTLNETTRSINDFIDWFGDVPVRVVTSDMIYDYRDEGQKLPRSMPRPDRELPFRERLARHADTDGERVSPATVKKRIGAIQALLSFAHGERWIADNAGLRVKINGYSRTNRARRSSRDGELKALFATPLFTDPTTWNHGKAAVSGLTLYWLFLIGTTTGARLEEVGQARLADVQKDAGILFIDVDDRELEPIETDGDKSVKNENSRRVLPVHDRLLRLGFEHYCDALRRAGCTMVFPDLAADAFGKRTKEASRVANRYLDRHVSSDRRLVFHSLRHKFKDEGRSAGVQERVLDQIAGHAPASVGARYGDGASIPALKRELDKLTFDAVDWAAMEAAVAELDWDAVVADYVTRLRSRKPA